MNIKTTTTYYLNIKSACDHIGHPPFSLQGPKLILALSIKGHWNKNVIITAIRTYLVFISSSSMYIKLEKVH